MVFKFGPSALALILAPAAAFASPSPILPLVSHRAAYELSLVDPPRPRRTRRRRRPPRPA